MNELQYGNHKWVTRLVNFINNPWAKWSRDDREIYPSNLCQLFWASIGSLFRTLFVLLLIMMVVGLLFAVIYEIAWPVVQPFFPASDTESAIGHFILSMASYAFLGVLVSIYLEEVVDCNSVWRQPIWKLVRKRKRTPESRKVDKQPSLIVEYVKGVKNKVCPLSDMRIETND